MTNNENNNELKLDPSVIQGVKVFRDVISLIPRFIWILPILGLLGYLVLKMMYKDVETTYSASLTFMISQDSDVSGGGNVLEDLGLLGGQGSVVKGKLSPKRIIELSSTRLVLSRAIFREVEISDTSDYLANHYLRLIQENYEIDTSFFLGNTPLDSFSRKQNSMLNFVVNKLKSEHFKISVSPTNIFILTTSSNNEEFTKKLCENLYQSLSDFYIDKSIEKAQASYDFIDHRLDSISNILSRAENALASWRDNNANLIRARGYLTEERLIRKVATLNNVYLETSGRHQVAKLVLDNQTPIFQVIDPPTYPLPASRKRMKDSYPLIFIACIAFYLFIIVLIYLIKNYGYLVKEFLNATK